MSRALARIWKWMGSVAQRTSYAPDAIRTAGTPGASGSPEFMQWRKPVGVEPTSDAAHRSLVLKTRPGTGQEWLPL